ncbi:MAG TPA: proline dehydrogenase family protein, partial [Beutenbergiaceae bacterium]|nr:proline dehydrogenase family protein [Beutenbergiaceae bacterium]
MSIEHLSNRASALARMWATAATGGRERRAAQQLADLVADPGGLDFAVEFVDRVARPEDPTAAARALGSLDTRNATFLSALDRRLLRAGRALAPHLPKLVVPAARRRLRALVGHLIVDADEESLTRHIASMLATGYRLNLNLLGEAVLGEREARSRTNRTIALLQRPDVDYVSVKVSSLVSQINPWDLAEGSNRVIERLRPVFAQAMASSPHKFVNLDMEEYRDLALTVEVFEQLLSEPEFMHLSAGIVLQAYLPDSAEAMRRLIGFATRRVQAGGAP